MGQGDRERLPTLYLWSWNLFGAWENKVQVLRISLGSCRIENSRTVPTTAKKCSGGRNLGLFQTLLLHQMGAGHRLGLLFRIENSDSFWLRFRSFLPSRHCVNTELAFAGGIFSACAMRREKRGKIEPSTWRGSWSATQHADAQRGNVHADYPTSRQVRGGRGVERWNPSCVLVQVAPATATRSHRWSTRVGEHGHGVWPCRR